jgi:hypothetical protein
MSTWWLNGSAPDYCPAVPSSNPASPQPTADCQPLGGLPPGMVLGCGLTSVRGDRGKNLEKNGPWVRQKTYKEKKVYEHICELGTLDQAPKSRTAKPNSDRGENVRASINSPVYRRGQCSQSTVDMKTKRTETFS